MQQLLRSRRTAAFAAGVRPSLWRAVAVFRSWKRPSTVCPPERDVMIRSLPRIAFGKVEGKINSRVTRKHARIKLDAVHSEPLRLGQSVDDLAPAVEPVVKSERGGTFDQEGAA